MPHAEFRNTDDGTVRILTEVPFPARRHPTSLRRTLLTTTGIAVVLLAASVPGAVRAFDVNTPDTVADGGTLTHPDQSIIVTGTGTLTFEGAATVNADNDDNDPFDEFSVQSGATVVIANGEVDFSEDRVFNDGTFVIGGTGSITGEDEFYNSASGTAQVSGTIDMPQVTNAGGTFVIDGDLTVTGDFDNGNGMLTFSAGAPADHVLLDVEGSFENAAGVTVILGATNDLTATDIQNAGTMTVQGALNTQAVVTGPVTNTGTLSVGGTIDGDIDNQGFVGLLTRSEVTGTLTNTTAAAAVTLNGTDIAFGQIDNTAGLVSLVGAEATGDIRNDAQMDLYPGDSTLTGVLTLGATGEVRNVSGADLGLTPDGFVVEGGTMNTGTGGTFTVTTDYVTYYGLYAETGTGTLVLNAGEERWGIDVTNTTGIATNTVVLDGATYTVGADIGAGGYDLTVEGALVVNGNLTGVGAFAQTGGSTAIGDGQTLEADSFDLSGGTFSIGANATLSGTGNTLDNAITLDVADGGTVQDAGAINNLGTGIINFAGNGTMTVDADGAGGEVITNAGAINFNGGAGTTVNINSGGAAANLTNTGGLTLADGSTVAGAGPLNIDNQGTVTIGDGAALNVTALDATDAASVIDINGGTLALNGGAGTLQNGGTLTLAGTIDGAVENTNDFDVDGAGAQITGTLTNSGDMDIAGSADLTVGGAATNQGGGTLDIGTGGTLDVSAAGLTNTGAGSTVTANGQIFGDVRNESGATVDVNPGGSIAGNFENDALAFLAGDIFGNLTNEDDGELTVENDMAVSGDFTNEGDADIDGGTLTVGGATANQAGGDLEIAAGATLDVTANGLTNTGSGTLLTVGGTLDGDVTNDSAATLDLNAGGEITGTLDNTATATLAGNIGGDLNNTGAGAVTVDGSVLLGGNFLNEGDADIDAGTLTVIGTATNQAGGTLDIADGAVLDTDGGSLTNTGAGSVATVAGDLTGDVTNEADAQLVIAATGDVSGTVTNGADFDLNGGAVGAVANEAGGDFDVTGGGTVDTTIDNAALMTVNSGALSVGGDVTNDTGATIRLAGGDMTVAQTATLTNRGAILIGDGDTLSAGTIENNTAAVISVGAGATLEGTANTLNNNGVISVADGGTVTDAGAINNLASGTITFAGAGTLNAGGAGAGTITNDGAINATGGVVTVDGDDTIANRAGAFIVLSGGDLTGAGTITNTGVAGTPAVILVGAGDTLGAGEIQNTLGEITVETGGTIELNGTLDRIWNAADATLTLNGGTVVGDVTNAGAGAAIVSTGDSAVDGTLSVLNDTPTATVDVTSGSLTVTEGLLQGENAGTVTVAAGTALSADYVTNGSLITNNGTLEAADYFRVDASGTIVSTNALIAGNRIINRGEIDIEGSVSGAVINDNIGGATPIFDVTGDLTGDDRFDNEAGGTLNVTGGNFTGITTLTSDGAIVIADTRTLQAGVIDINGGTVSVGAGATLQGTENTLTNSGTIDVAANGTVTDAGSITNEAAGVINFNGAFGTATLNSDLGVIGNYGDINVTGAGTVVVNGTVTNYGTGTIDVLAGTMTLGADDMVNQGAVTVAAGATLSVDILTGQAGSTLTNTGTLNVTDFANAGTATNSGSINGSVTNTGTFNANGGDFDDFANAGTFNLNAATAGAGTFANAGMFVGNGNALTGLTTFDNQAGGVIDATASVTLAATSFINDGTVDAGDGAADDTITITGDVTGTGIYVLDVEAATATADMIVVAGTIGGAALVDFQLDAATLAADTTFATATGGIAPGSFDFLNGEVTVNGTPVAAIGGPIEYEITDGVLESRVNDGIAASAGAIGLVQSLLGTVVNRPSSAFVTGLAYEDDSRCVNGSWARFVAGQAEATSTTYQNGNGRDATVEAEYGGVQTGFDIGCNDWTPGGWDVTVGGMFGFNRGNTTQDVLSRDTSGDLIKTSVTSSDFDQTYVGAYVAGARGSWVGDLQIRQEWTDYSFTNSPLAGFTGLGLDDTQLDSEATTLSGSLSYNIPLQGNWQLLPTGGFQISHTTTEDLVFADIPTTPADESGVLSFDDYTSTVGFLGATISRYSVNAAGDAGTQYFATATVYNEFSGKRGSSFSGPLTTPQELETEALGAFGELSLGVSYAKIFDGQAGAIKQLNASVRADARFSDDVEGLGVTAQIRFNF